MEQVDVYLFGMILATSSFLLKDEYPKADTYGEIKVKYKLPGGETGTCATVLDSLGCYVKMDGNYMGNQVLPMIQEFYSNKKVDLSALTFEETYDGLEDYVIIDKNTRTPFGMFQSFYGDTVKRWNMPKREDIEVASVIGLDPFFEEASEKVAILCHELGKKYVTIDCHHESVLHKYADVTAISNEFFVFNDLLKLDREELFREYQEHTEGLVIFTHGSKDVMYGRRGQEIKRFTPYKVETISTLGAGDTFKAGCVYGVLKGMSDDEIVRFASACAAIACTKYPLPLNPPKFEEVKKLMEQGTTK
jgi:sugar/nucleoside kinase (ribokinase family)